MKERDDKRRTTARNRFDRAMVDSTDLLAEYLDDVQFPIDPNDFLIFELGRVLNDGNASFMNEEFRLLIEQCIRLTVDPNLDVRARLAERLRQVYRKMPARARRITPEIIGAIEDSDFALDRIGAVVRSYTNQLFETLENLPVEAASQDLGRREIESWKAGDLDRFQVLENLGSLGPAAVPAVSDLLFESLNEPPVVDMCLTVLSMLESPLSARVLAYMVSEPILEEAHEERARAILKDFWPLPRTYMLYRLKQHSHEDIPFRWLELLVEQHEPRAVDRILEEVVAHARVDSYREDLLAALGLLERSDDPGVVGKLLRLMTEDSAPEAPLDIVEEWLENSSLAEPVEAALERWNRGKMILVPAHEDFSSFAATQPDSCSEELREDWTNAYHEALNWQQHGQFARGPVERDFEKTLEETMMRQLSLNPRLDDDSLHDQIESFREDWLVTPRDNVIPLVAIYLERPRGNPWDDDVYWRGINSWYTRAAQRFDEGNIAGARHLLDIVLRLEPGYPLAQMLDRIVSLSAAVGGEQDRPG